MKNLFFLLVFTLTIRAAHAAPVFTLDSSALTATQGASVGWGFSLTSDDQYWVSVTGSSLDSETNPNLGLYSDLIGLQGGPSDFSLSPGSLAWVQSFNLSLATGVGAYAVSPFATIGAVNFGVLSIFIEYFANNPLTCGDCYIGSDIITSAVSIEIVDAQVPEPASITLCAAGLAAAAIRNRRRSRS